MIELVANDAWLQAPLTLLFSGWLGDNWNLSGLCLWADQPNPQGGGGWGMLPAFAVIGVLFYFMMIRPQRREQQQRQSMIDTLKKNDRVVTIGGIHGVVTNVRKEADEVKVRVDEKTNTELRFSLSAISRVIRDEPSEKESTDKPST